MKAVIQCKLRREILIVQDVQDYTGFLYFLKKILLILEIPLILYHWRGKRCCHATPRSCFCSGYYSAALDSHASAPCNGPYRGYDV